MKTFKNCYLLQGQPHDKSPLGYPAYVWTNVPKDFVPTLIKRLEETSCHGICHGNHNSDPDTYNVYFWMSPRYRIVYRLNKL